jgi:hypothetical protein
MPEIDPSYIKLLGALTLTACKHLGTDTAVIDADGRLQSWRVCVVEDAHALVDIDDSGLCSINCYAIEAENFDAFDGGVRFKIDPQCLVYSLQLDKGHTPDLTLLQEMPAEWISAPNLVLLSALRRRAPQAIDGRQWATSCRCSMPSKRIWIARPRGGIDAPSW